MDKSPGYRALCAKAEEVQACWVQTHGDFFVGEENRLECWVEGVHTNRQVNRGFGITRTGEKVIQVTRYVWLPRLDQLMELAQVQGRRFESVSQEFFTWCKKPYPGEQKDPRNLFPTLEQVWLAFVMQSRYGKVWNKTDWVPVETVCGS